MLPEEPMPLFLLCRVRLGNSQRGGEEQSVLPRLPAFGCLTMGAVSPVAETAAEDAFPEEVAAAEALACWTRLREAATAVFLQQQLRASGESENGLALSSSSTAAGGGAAVEGLETEGTALPSASRESPVLALRKASPGAARAARVFLRLAGLALVKGGVVCVFSSQHQFASEAVRLEDVAELLSLLCRSSLSCDSLQRQLAASAAASLAVQGLPVYSLLFDCLDGLLSSALSALQTDASEAPGPQTAVQEDLASAEEASSAKAVSSDCHPNAGVQVPFFMDLPVSLFSLKKPFNFDRRSLAVGDSRRCVCLLSGVRARASHALCS